MPRNGTAGSCGTSRSSLSEGVPDCFPQGPRRCSHRPPALVICGPFGDGPSDRCEVAVFPYVHFGFGGLRKFSQLHKKMQVSMNQFSPSLLHKLWGDKEKLLSGELCLEGGGLCPWGFLWLGPFLPPPACWAVDLRAGCLPSLAGGALGSPARRLLQPVPASLPGAQPRTQHCPSGSDAVAPCSVPCAASAPCGAAYRTLSPLCLFDPFLPPCWLCVAVSVCWELTPCLLSQTQLPAGGQPF